MEASNAATIAVGSVMGVMPNRVTDVPLVAVLPGRRREFDLRTFPHGGKIEGVPVNRALAQVYEAVGLPTLAQQAARHADAVLERVHA